MRALLLCAALLLGLSAWLLSCGGGCRVSSQCDPGQRCDFDTQTCVQGCTSNEDCNPGVCDSATGRCKPTFVTIPDIGGRRDAGTSTTSSTADAGM